MNSWTEIYKKCEKEPEMIKFREWCFNNGLEDGGHPISFSKSNIKTMWGFLVEYVAKDGWQLNIEKNTKQVEDMGKWLGMADIEDLSIIGYYYSTPKETMFWCAKKYFEITKGE